ncbi:MAG: SDR family oxidoreductase [Candidatus Kerfeldbacteria bacterium]|nr:SDR family oxidoreductase [Candidatus Kerfeldbacteria bacterium]
MKTILVTGGAGFIGSHLSESLLTRGDRVICVDNFYSSQRENVSHLLENPNFRLIEHDVTLPMMFECDEIYHLACPASPVYYQHNPVYTVRTNVSGSINVLDLAKKLRIKVLLTSTSEVYGDPEVHPQPETYVGHVNPIGPRACYDEGKRCAETLFFDYHREYNVDIRVARIFNTYGPRMHPDDGRVISNFIMQALQHQPITINGDGSQTRSFQYVDDCVRGLIALMDNADIVGPVNIGNPEEYTIKEMAEIVLKNIPQTQSKIVFTPAVVDDPKQRKPDITLARNILQWSPKVPFENGLKRSIPYYRSFLSNTK